MSEKKNDDSLQPELLRRWVPHFLYGYSQVSPFLEASRTVDEEYIRQISTQVAASDKYKNANDDDRNLVSWISVPGLGANAIFDRTPLDVGDMINVEFKRISKVSRSAYRLRV